VDRAGDPARPASARRGGPAAGARRAILDGGDELDLAGPDLVAALGRHYARHPQLGPLLETFQDRVDSSLPARWQVEQLSRQVFAALDQVAFDTVKRHSQQAALLAMLSRLPLVDFLIALWRSLALVRQIARTYGARPGAAGSGASGVPCCATSSTRPSARSLPTP